MERKFKVGDRVEVIREDCYIQKGTVFVIKDVMVSGVYSDSGYYIEHYKLKLINDMRKEDLKTGMRVELRNGFVGMVVIGNQFNDTINGESWARKLDYYNNDMSIIACESYNTPDFDIVAVYTGYNYDRMMNLKHNGELLWERNEVKEYTMAELEEKLGEKIKIKK